MSMMSPKIIPIPTIRSKSTSGKVYTDLIDTINNRTFSARHPESYEPAMSEFFMEHKTAPFYNPISAEADWCTTRVSVATVIDMCYNKVEFEIPNDDDMDVIYEILSSYVELTTAQLKHMSKTDNQDARAFYDKAVIAKGTIGKFLDRKKRYLARTNPNTPKQKPRLGDMINKLG